MSSDGRAALPVDGNGLLPGSRARSYGSLVNSSVSPTRHRVVQHRVQPGETLQGLALRYGVSMEQIKRANRLYTNESIFLKKSLSIPLLSDPGAGSVREAPAEQGSGDGSTCVFTSNENSAKPLQSKQGCQDEGESELSPMDFLKRMDCLIGQSKKAAVKGCQDREKRFAAIEAACSSKMAERCRLTRSQSAVSAAGMHHHTSLLAVPPIITKRTKKLREREDEIFEL